jgi:thiamine-phosphate diphosphorylase
MRPLPRLYAIADGSFGDPVAIAGQLYGAGVRLVQLRNKVPSGLLLEQASRIAAVVPTDSMLIVNDRADIALLAGTAGVHVGQEDLPPALVRSIVGQGVLVGLSTHNPVQAKAATGKPVDYIAVGPVFETRTKANSSPVVGLRGLETICGSVDLPVVAIGGIRLENACDALRAGARSVAVISDLISTGDVRDRARRFLEKLNECGNV